MQCAAALAAYHKLASALIQSSTKLLIYHDILARSDRPQSTPPQATPGRWNSELRLLRNLTQNWECLIHVPGLPLPTPEQQTIAKGLINLLLPFEKASTLLQVQKRPSASLVFPMVYYLNSFCSELDECTFSFCNFELMSSLN